MKFGILASHQYPRHEDLTQRLGELFDLVSFAAESGYDSVFTINHFLANLQTPQALSMTARLIECSGDMRLGTGILLLPFYHPVHIAEEVATLDQLSGGRIVLGVGAGYRDNEFRAMGVDKRERIARMREGIDLLRALWTGEEVEHHGRFFEVVGERIGIDPVQEGGPPIWIGGGVERAVQRAARIGDAWFAPGNSPDPRWLDKATVWHDRALEEAGRADEPRERPIIVELFCGATTEQAREACRPYIRDEYFAYSDYGQLSWQQSMFETLWEKVFIIGSPDDVTAGVQRLADLGFDHVIFRPFWTGMPAEVSRESVRLVATEVMPRFAS